MFKTTVASSDWLRDLCERQPEAARLLAASEAEQRKRGYFHTLREILQQPSTWTHTADQISALGAILQPALAGIRNLVLTGSGSSEYAGHCVQMPLQTQLGVNTLAIGGGVLLTSFGRALPPGRPALLVSLARSGDSPESVGALSMLLHSEPELRHLVLTCNAAGKLATSFQGDSRVRVVTLHDGTNDRSLVMTSSFTNLVIAAQVLGFLDDGEMYRSRSRALSKIASQIFEAHFGTLARIGSLDFKRALFLASGPRLGAALEGALKMLEMTAGQVSAMSETYLGLRHGPMSFVNDDTLVVCFLSSEPTVRAYQCELIRELQQKELGMLKVVVGDDIPADLLQKQDVAIDCPGLAHVGDEGAPIIDVVVSQLLGFFRCLRQGLRPDSPSESGIINRVVQSFTLHVPTGSPTGDGH